MFLFGYYVTHHQLLETMNVYFGKQTEALIITHMQSQLNCCSYMLACSTIISKYARANSASVESNEMQQSVYDESTGRELWPVLN